MALPNFLKFLELSSDNSLKLLNSENDKTKRFLSFIGVLNLNKKNDAGQTLLHQAIENNQTDVAKYLVDKGADLNLPDTKGNTPLHIATKNNQTEVTKYLVDKGARLDLQNNEGKIPLDMADPSSTEMFYQEIDLNERPNNTRGTNNTFNYAKKVAIKLLKSPFSTPSLTPEMNDVYQKSNPQKSRSRQ